MLKLASFFAGVGGIELGFKQCKIIYANEIDQNAVTTYQSNFCTPVDCRDIALVDETKLQDFDILLGGFPCQAFSIAGHRLGFLDSRGNVFFELIRIIKCKKPKAILLENVKNLVAHDNGNTFLTILDELQNLGYWVKYQVMNATEYGNTPQNRERIYIVCFRNKKHYQKFDFPTPIRLSQTIQDIVDFDLQVNQKYYYTPRFKHFDLLQTQIKKANTLYQWRRQYVRENKSGVCPTLTANMGTGGHNVPIALTKHGIRKLTPKECFLFQGFPREFILPQLTDNHLYKQAGNSVCVKVIKRIADNIINALKT